MTTLKKKKPTLLQALIPIVFMIVALAIGYANTCTERPSGKRDTEIGRAHV